MAILTSWLRVRTPVFPKSCWTTALTEPSESPMLSPIFRLDKPPSIPESTFCSRSVRPFPSKCSASAGYFSASIRITRGAIHISPMATVRTAGINLSTESAFRKIPEAPSLSMRAQSRASAEAVITNNFPGRPERAAPHSSCSVCAESPSNSSSTTSGEHFVINSRACGAGAHSPTKSKSGSSDSIRPRLARSSA